jgi:hypothetical protein
MRGVQSSRIAVVPSPGRRSLDINANANASGKDVSQFDLVPFTNVIRCNVSNFRSRIDLVVVSSRQRWPTEVEIDGERCKKTTVRCGVVCRCLEWRETQRGTGVTGLGWDLVEDLLRGRRPGPRSEAAQAGFGPYYFPAGPLIFFSLVKKNEKKNGGASVHLGIWALGHLSFATPSPCLAPHQGGIRLFPQPWIVHATLSM